MNSKEQTNQSIHYQFKPWWFSSSSLLVLLHFTIPSILLKTFGFISNLIFLGFFLIIFAPAPVTNHLFPCPFHHFMPIPPHTSFCDIVRIMCAFPPINSIYLTEVRHQEYCTLFQEYSWTNLWDFSAPLQTSHIIALLIHKHLQDQLGLSLRIF